MAILLVMTQNEYMKHRPKHHQSLRFNLTSAFVLLVLATSVVLGTLLFLVLRTQMEEDLRTRLKGYATTLALAIDPAEHATLDFPDDMEGPIYQKYANSLPSSDLTTRMSASCIP